MSANPQAQEAILLREDRDGICTLTMNRPAQMNLLTTEMLSALQSAFQNISRDGEIRVVILAATGKGFCAGHDLREIRALKELPNFSSRTGEDRSLRSVRNSVVLIACTEKSHHAHTASPLRVGMWGGGAAGCPTRPPRAS